MKCKVCANEIPAGAQFVALSIGCVHPGCVDEASAIRDEQLKEADAKHWDAWRDNVFPVMLEALSRFAPPQEGKPTEQELALWRTRQAIGRACQVIEALSLDEWASDTEGDRNAVCIKERHDTRRELCDLRARERKLAAEVEKGETKP